MRCLECNRLAGENATRCPYCGSAMLSAVEAEETRERAAEVRAIWDDTGPGDKVVYLPRRERGPDAKLLALDALVWVVAWSAAALALDVAALWGTWIALVVAIACNNTVLYLLEAPPWWAGLAAALRSRRSKGDDVDPPQASASNM